MLTSGYWEREALLIWHEGQAPIIAAAVALAAWLLGRVLRAAALQTTAAGLGLCAGWLLTVGGLNIPPHVPPERLPVLAIVALAVGFAVDWSGRAAGLAGVVLAVAAGWWLAGAPRSDAEANPVLPHMACLALAMLLALRLLRAPRSPWTASAAALTLWGALLVAGAPPGWVELGLVLLAASLGQVGAPRGAAAVRLPMAAGLVGLAGLAALTVGHVGRSGVARIDLAAVAPLLTLWLLPRVAGRLPWGAGLVAGVVSAVVAVGAVWACGRLGVVR